MRFKPKQLIKLLSPLTTTNELLWLTEYALTNIKTKKYPNYKISYHEISNMLVDSVVLQNKPLSNLEIIGMAKKLHCMDLEDYF